MLSVKYWFYIFSKWVYKVLSNSPHPNPPHYMERAQLLDPSLRIGEGVGGEEKN